MCVNKPINFMSYSKNRYMCFLPGIQEWLDPECSRIQCRQVFGQNGGLHVHQDDTIYHSKIEKKIRQHLHIEL